MPPTPFVRVQGARARALGEPLPGPSDAVCLHYQRGVCRFGEACAFRHVSLFDGRVVEEADGQNETSEESALVACQRAFRAAEARLANIRAAGGSREEIADAAATLREIQVRVRAMLKGAASNRLAIPRRQRRPKNENRAGIFRRFLLDTYGHAALASGSGVLDVAGGAGLLSFELLNYSRVPVTVVDPRETLRLTQHEWRVAVATRRRASTSVCKPDADAATGDEDGDDGDDGDGTTGDDAEAGGEAATEADAGADTEADTEAATGAVAEAATEADATTEAEAASGHIVVPTTALPLERSTGTPRRPRHWRLYWRDALWKPVLEMADESPASRFGSPCSRSRLGTCPSAAALAAVEAALVEAPPLSPSSRRRRKTSSTQDAAAVPATTAEVAAGTAASVDNGGDIAHGQLSEAPTAPMAPTAMEVCTILQGCSAVVGMHPDAATESIVDFALAAGLPFAVVPCCVFAVDFAHRRGPEGQPVNNHSAFVRYLQAKAPDRIGVATLPFEGKNVVLYSLPKRVQGTRTMAGGEACELCAGPSEV